MVWFRYLSNKEVLGTTTPNENYSYPLLKRQISKFTPKDTVPDKTWLFVDVTDLNIDKYYDANLQLQTDDASYVVVYEDPFTDDYFVPVKTVIHEDILYFETAEEHPAGIEIEKQYAVYYKTKGLRKIVEVDNGGRKDYQIYNLPVWVDNQLATIPIDASYSDSVFAVSDPVATYSISRGRLPEGITLNPVTGAVTGTTTYVGRYFFTIRATSIHGYIEADFSDDIATNPVTPPTTIPNFYFNKNYYHSFAIQSTRPTVYYISSGSLPDGVSLDRNTGIATGIVSLDKPYYSNVQYNFTLAVEDQYGTSYTQYTGYVYHPADWKYLRPNYWTNNETDVLQFIPAYNRESADLDEDYLDYIIASGYPQVKYKIEKYNIIGNGIYTSQNNVFYDKNISAAILELNLNSKGSINQTKYSQLMESANIIETDSSGGFYLAGNFTSTDTIKYSSAESRKIVYINSSGFLSNWNLTKNSQSYYAVGLLSSVKLVGSNVYMTTGNVGFYENASNSVINYQFGIASKQSGQILDLNLHTKNDQLPGKFTDSLVIGSNIYISGEFTSVNLPESSYINYDTQQHTSLPPYPIAASSNIYVVHRDSLGGIYLGGTFTSINGETRNRLAYINSLGKLDNLNINVNGAVYAITTVGSNIYIGGNFTAVNSQNAGNIGVVTRFGQTLNLGLNTNGTVRSLEAVGSNIYIAGAFTQIIIANPVNAGTSYSRARFGVAAINTSGSLLSWRLGLTSNSGPNIFVLRHSENVIYIGGKFTEVSYPISSLYKINKNGTISDPIVEVSNDVYAVTNDATGGYYVGGNFAYVDGEIRKGIAYVNSNGSLTSWNPDISGTIYDIALNGDNVYVAGNFTTSQIPGTRYLTAFDINGEQLEWNPTVNGNVYSIKIINNIVYAGGNFTSVDNFPRFGLVAINSLGVVQETWNPSTNGQVRTLYVDGENIYVGGDFTLINDNARLQIALVNTSANVLSWDPGSKGNVYTIAKYANVIYVGGDFALSGGNVKSSAYKYNTSGYLVANNIGIVPNIFSLEQDAAGGFYIGGNFTSVGGETRNRAAYINSSGQLTSWDPNINGPVYSMRVYGDNIYIGGSFTSVGNNTRYSLAAVNTVGNLLGWNPQTDGTVYNIFNIGNNIYIGGNYRTLGGLRSRYLKIAGNGSSNTTSYAISQPIRTIVRDVTGGIYIGGDFTSIGDQVRNRIAYLNSLGFLTDWSPNVNGNVHSIAVLGSNIYFGGAFTSVNGNVRNRLAAVNNSGNLLTWNPNSDGNIYAVAIAANTQVWVGGQFEFLRLSNRDNNLAVVDTLNGTRLASGYLCNGPVHAISVSGVNIYVGGAFSTVASFTRNKLAAFNTTGSIIAWGPNVNANGTVYALAIRGVNIYIGGNFSTVRALNSTSFLNTFTRTNMAVVNTAGYMSTSFIANTNNTVFSISIFGTGTNVYFGGQFTTVNGTSRNRIAGMTTTGTLLADWTPGVDGNVLAIVAYQDGATPSFHVGGEFVNSTDRLRNSLGSVDTSGNILTFNPNVISNSTTNTVGTVYAITSSGSNIYVGGEFTLVNGNARNRLAALNASANVLSWNPNASGTVRSISVAGTNAYVGGDFLKVGNIDRTYAAVVNVSTTNTILGWNITIDAPVRQIVFNNEINDAAATPYIYLAGDFTTVENEKRMYSAKVNTLEGLASWNPSTNGNVFALSIYGDNVMIAGPFDDSADTEKPYIFAVDDLENPVSWNPIVNGTVRKIAITGEGVTPNIYIGGDFTTVNGNNQKYVAGLNVTNGLLSWSPNINNSVYDIEIFGDNIYFGGSFNFLHKKVVQNFSAINTEGSLTDFEINADSTIRDIRFIGSNIYIGGEFSLINGTTRNYLAAVNTAETLLSWNPNPNGNVHAIATVGSNIYFGGEFTQVSGSATRAYIAGETAADENILLYNNNLSINGPVYAIASGENNIFVGGGFTDYNIYNRSNLMAINTSGKVLPWNPNVNAIVKTMTSIGSNIYIAGNFTKVNNLDYKGLAAINTSGNLLSWNPYLTNLLNNVYSMIVYDNSVIVGGFFEKDPTQHYYTRFNALNDNADSIGNYSFKYIDGYGVYTFAKDENNGFYIGGDFTSFSSDKSAYVAVDNLGNATPIQSIVNFENVNATAYIYSIKVDSTGGFYIAGRFDFVNNVFRKNIAYINSSGYLTEFNPYVSGGTLNGQILALDTLGDNIYIGGSFTEVNGVTRNRLAALNTSGGLLNWNPSASANVWSMKVSGNNIYVGGDFTTINGNSRNRLAAVNVDGTIQTWNPPTVSSTIRSIDILSNNIYIGGDFLTVGGSNRGYLAAIDISTGVLQGWNPNANSIVYAITVSGSNIYVGGSFTAFNTAGVVYTLRNSIALINTNGNVQTTWNPNANGVVRAIKVNQTNIYIGGDFTTINGVTRNKSAAIGTNNTLLTWNLNLNSGTTSNVFAIDVDNSGLSTKIYFAGTSNIYQDIKTRNRLAYINSSGSLTDWNPNVNGNVYIIIVSGTNVYIGGAFTSVSGITRRSVAALSTVDVNATGNLLSWNPGVSYYNSITTTHTLGQVRSMIISGANIYIGGLFNSIAQSSRTSFGAVTTSGTVLSLGTGILSNISNQAIYAMAMSGQNLYIGGKFKVTSNTANQYSIITTASGSVSYSNFNTKIYAAAADSSGGFYVGGEFTSIGEQTRSNLAYINSIGLISSWNPLLALDLSYNGNPFIKSIIKIGDNIYFGGLFTSVNGTTRNYLAAVNTNGDLLEWNPNAGSQVLSMASIGSNIYISGYFSSFNGSSRFGLAAVNTNGTLLGWNPGTDQDIYEYSTLVTSGSNIYIGGEFSLVAGQKRNHIAAVNTNGNLLDWNPNTNGAVKSIVCIGENIYFGGYFTSVAGNTRNRLAAVNSSGSLLAWNPNANSVIESITVSGSNIYVAGNFLKISNEKRYYVAGISSQGLGELLDYNIPYVDDEISFIYASNQKILISGEFRSIDANLKESFAVINVSSNEVLPLNLKFKANTTILYGSDRIESIYLEQGTVQSIASDGDNIYIGGHFNYINDVKRERIAAINSSGNILEFSPRVYKPDYESGLPKMRAYSDVKSIYVLGDNIYIGGYFTAVNDTSGLGLSGIGSAAVVNKSGELLDWYPNITGSVQKIEKIGQNIYICGDFTQFNYINRDLGSIDLGGKFVYTKYSFLGNSRDRQFQNYNRYVNKIKESNNTIYVAANYKDNQAGVNAVSLLSPLLYSVNSSGVWSKINIPKHSMQEYSVSDYDDVLTKTAYINDVAILNDKIYLAGKFETDTLPVGLQLNSTTGEISGIHESKYYGKVVKEDTSTAVLSSKYFTFDFSWTDGVLLNTKTAIINPILSSLVGYMRPNSIDTDQVSLSLSNFLYWKMNNDGSGYQSLLFDKTNFDIAYPGTNEITFRINAGWLALEARYIPQKVEGSMGINPVTLNISAYSGTLTIGSRDSLYGYKDWSINSPVPQTYENFSSYSKVVNTIAYELWNSYYDIADSYIDVTLDFINGKVIYTTAYEKHVMIVSAENELGYIHKSLEM